MCMAMGPNGEAVKMKEDLPIAIATRSVAVDERVGGPGVSLGSDARRSSRIRPGSLQTLLASLHPYHSAKLIARRT